MAKRCRIGFVVVAFWMAAAVPGTAFSEEIAALQKILTERGCDPGSVDGIWGGKTANALAQLTAGTAISINRPVDLVELEAITNSSLRCGIPNDAISVVSFPRDTELEAKGAIDTGSLGCSSCVPIQRILATPDFDGDGTPEIVVGFEAFDGDIRPTENPIEIQVFRRDGRAYEHFAGAVSRVHPREGLVGDFNGDGLDDLFVAAHGKDGPPFPGERNVLILSSSDGMHHDVSAENLPQLDVMTHGAGLGDIDSDGDLDIAAVTNANGGRARLSNYFLINDGTGSFTLSKGSNHLPPGAPRQVQRFLTARLADLNGDGHLDLIYAGFIERGQASLVLSGDGDGKFRNPVALPFPNWRAASFVTDIDPVDFDQDGDLDLVLLHSGEINGKVFRGLYIQFLVNDRVSFRDETEHRFWPQDYANTENFFIAHNISFADFDEDGDPDFAVQSLNPLEGPSSHGGPFQLALNRGYGIFDPIGLNSLPYLARSMHQIAPYEVQGSVGLIGLSHARSKFSSLFELVPTTKE